MIKRFIFKQNGNFHTVIDTVENKPMGVFEFKENEFGKYACFHMIIDKMNELHEEKEQLLHIIDWCLTHHREVGHIVFDSRDEFFIWLKEKKLGSVEDE